MRGFFAPPARTHAKVPNVSSDAYSFRSPTGSDLYIDAGAGSDGTGTLASPWKTISSARYASIAPGQCLWVRGTGSTLSWADCTNAQSGTSVPGGGGSQVVVSGYPGDPIPSISFTDAGQRVGGSTDTRGFYHWWRNLDIQCSNVGILLANNYTLAGDTLSKYFTISDCTGTRSSVSVTDNSGIFSAYGNSSTSISSRSVAPVSVIRCAFTGPTGSTQNQSLLLLEYQPWMQIIGNLLVATANPIYFKHNFAGTALTQYALVKNNILRSAGRGIQVAANYVDYINNAFDGSALDLDESGGDAGGNNCTLTHNTFLNSDIGMSITDGGTVTHQNNVARNNVFIGTSRWQDNPFSGNSGQNQNNNIDYSAADAGNHWVRNSSGYTRSTYNTAFGQEANGLQGACTLAGGTTPGSTALNWALTGGSVGIGNASDSGSRGVNATNLLTVN